MQMMYGPHGWRRGKENIMADIYDLNGFAISIDSEEAQAEMAAHQLVQAAEYLFRLSRRDCAEYVKVAPIVNQAHVFINSANVEGLMYVERG